MDACGSRSTGRAAFACTGDVEATAGARAWVNVAFPGVPALVDDSSLASCCSRTPRSKVMVPPRVAKAIAYAAALQWDAIAAEYCCNRLRRQDGSCRRRG